MIAALVVGGTALLAIVTQMASSNRFLPHAFCISASQPLLWLHLVSDSLISLAYLLIPWALLHFTRRRPDLPFSWVSWVFGAFIIACGLTHAFEVWTLYYPVYWISGITKAFTAAVSLATAWLLYQNMPLALALPSSEQLRQANRALSDEVAARQSAEHQLRAAKRQVEELLEQTQRRAEETAAVLAHFFKAAPMGMAVLDKDLRLQRSNPALASLMVDPHLLEAVRSITSQVRLGGARREFEVECEQPAGRRTVRSTVFEIPFENTVRLGWIAQDITDQVRASSESLQAMEDAANANRQAAEERAQFQALADNISQLAWMTNPEGWIYWYNRRWFEYTGTTLEQMEGWGWKAVHHPDHVTRVEAKFREHLESGLPWEDTFPLRRADGNFRWFLSRAFPLRAPSGEILNWFGTNTDIHEQVVAQETLADADRRKDEFIAALAHELRNPLAPVRTSAEILARLGKGNERMGTATAIIERQTSHMARLIDDLLDVARLSRGKLEVVMQPCDLAQIVRTVCHDYQAALESSGNELTVHAKEPLAIDGDPVRLTQAIGNYLQNASKFARGTPVEVRAFSDPTEGEAVIQVSDGGPGISPEIAAFLFQPFAQGKQDLARSKGGLGLGLVITMGIAKLHGGSASAGNSAGGGAQFELRIPLNTRRL